MKKIVLNSLIILLFFSLGFTTEYADDIDISVNNEELVLEQPVKVEEGELLVPARIILEELGAEVKWDAEKRIASGVMGDFQVELPINSSEVKIDGEVEEWDVPLKIINNSTYAPARPLIEALGAFMQWNEEANTIEITTPEGFNPENWDDEGEPPLNVAYPPSSEYSIYGSPLFVFGTTRSYSQVDVTVNEEPVEKLDLRTGNFLTLVDVPREEEFMIEVEADSAEGTTSVERSVIYPTFWEEMPYEPLKLHSAHLKPDEDQVLGAGDSLTVAVQGSPGAEAEFRIGDEGEKVEMTEVEDPPWPLKGEGIYTGTYTVDDEDVPYSGISEPKPVTVTLRREGEQVTRELPGKVSLLAETPYKVVEVKEQPELKAYGWLRSAQADSFRLHANTRGGTVHSLSAVDYLVEGTRFEAVGAAGDYYRVKLGEEESFFLHKNAVRELEVEDTLRSSLPGIDIRETGETVSLRFNTTERIPFLIEEGRKNLELNLYGVEKEEFVSIPPGIPGSIEGLNVENFEEGAADWVTVNIKLEEEISGFQCTWEGTELVIDISKPPQVSEDSPLKNKTIVVDPGHGGTNQGALGPGDIHEKDAVLEMSLFLRDLLREEGAQVIMTRKEDENVDLYGRTLKMSEYDADLFISVHANAHAHGAQAVETHGLMTLYDYEHNEKLAEILLNRMEKEMELPATWTWRRKLAVLRHSEVPSVLIEAGYMKHPEDNWYILHPRGQKEFARAMKEGIKEYFLSF